MALGVGSWVELGEIPLTQVPEIYESFDQLKRFKRFEKREDLVYRALMAGVEMEMPEPWEYGVLE